MLLALLGACTLAGRAYLGGEAAQLAAREARSQRIAATPKPKAAPAVAPIEDASDAAGQTGEAVAPQTAEALNAARPFAGLPIEPMRPFVLKTDAADQARAEHCLAQAVYYEAAREPLRGQQAVAQVVLNRVRHPAYPKSVCGVVYQGAARATGCQFTFACDGSLRFAPQAALWARAEAVARRALSGYVDPDVGSATFYHAAYVAPYWAPSLVKMAQVGQHIFYRWTGAWGEPGAFVGRYAGREVQLTPAVLNSDPRIGDAVAPAMRTVTLGEGREARVYRVADAGDAGVARDRPAGVLEPTTRAPTPGEVRAINDHLARFERGLDAAPAAADAATPAAALAGMP
jgi:spore germination cell wall hydrolase CwlJ-like protein